MVNRNSLDNPYILVVHCDDETAESEVLQIVEKEVKKYVVKSKTVTGGKGIEFTIELRLKNMHSFFVNEISKLNGVRNAVMVSYNGDYVS